MSEPKGVWAEVTIEKAENGFILTETHAFSVEKRVFSTFAELVEYLKTYYEWQ